VNLLKRNSIWRACKSFSRK